MRLWNFAFVTVATAETVNLTRSNLAPKLIESGKLDGVNIGGARPLDPKLFKGIDLTGIDLGGIHKFPNLLLNDRPLKTIAISDPLFGSRPVSYYVTSNGLAVIDGDVTYGPVSSLFAHRTGAKVKDRRAFSGQPSWPNAEIT